MSDCGSRYDDEYKTCVTVIDDASRPCAGTSVSSNTVISSTTSLWALLISVLVLNEKASIPKLASVIVSCVGAALIAGQDKGESSVMGDGVCLVSAILFGLCSGEIQGLHEKLITRHA